MTFDRKFDRSKLGQRSVCPFSCPVTGYAPKFLVRLLHPIDKNFKPRDPRTKTNWSRIEKILVIPYQNGFSLAIRGFLPGTICLHPIIRIFTLLQTSSCRFLLWSSVRNKSFQFSLSDWRPVELKADWVVVCDWLKPGGGFRCLNPWWSYGRFSE